MMDPLPFEEKPSNESLDKNLPIILPTENNVPQGQDFKTTKTDRMLWYTIGGIVISACIVMILLAFSVYHSMQSQVQEIFTVGTPVTTYTPRPAITPNLTATQRAWIKPSQSPALASVEDVKTALNDDNTKYIEQYAVSFPDFPDINQPGDIYGYEIHINPSMTALWSYGWCTTTSEILDQNFAQMKVEFVMNGAPVSKDQLAGYDYQRFDGGQCRSLAALITAWPPGEHQLEVRVTFLQPTDDGWDIYPAGAHIFKYFVYVEN
jgi:hypothetical protein